MITRKVCILHPIWCTIILCQKLFNKCFIKLQVIFLLYCKTRICATDCSCTILFLERLYKLLKKKNQSNKKSRSRFKKCSVYLSVMNKILLYVSFKIDIQLMFALLTTFILLAGIQYHYWIICFMLLCNGNKQSYYFHRDKLLYTSNNEIAIIKLQSISLSYFISL